MRTSLHKISTTVRSKAVFFVLRGWFRLGSALFPTATARRAGRLFGTPLATTHHRARTAPRLGAREFDLPVEDHSVHTYVWGDPAREPYVLFAHGWSSHGTRIINWLPELRRAGYAVVAFDQYAHGLSPGGYATIPDFVQHLLAVGRHFGKASAVVAHSLGSAATMLALKAGLRAERVVLIAPAADPVDASQRFARMIGLARHACMTMLAQFESRYAIRFDEMQVHAVAPALAVPALVIHDLKDREVPWDEGECYARHWPAARLLNTEGLGHHRILDDHDVIAAGVGFLRGEAIGERVVSSAGFRYGLA